MCWHDLCTAGVAPHHKPCLLSTKNHCQASVLLHTRCVRRHMWWPFWKCDTLLIKIFAHTRFALVKCDPAAPDHPHSAATRGNPTHSLTEQAWCLISWQMSNDNRQWHPCYDVFFFWPDVQKQKRQHTNARCFTVLCTFEINKLLKELVHIHVQLHAWLQTARSFRWPRHDYSANAIGKKKPEQILCWHDKYNTDVGIFPPYFLPWSDPWAVSKCRDIDSKKIIFFKGPVSTNTVAGCKR